MPKFKKKTLPIITVKQTQPIITTIVQDTKTIIINKNKDGYRSEEHTSELQSP